MSISVTNNDFYSLHGMWGAFSSLALGRIGKGAGIVVGDVQPPEHGLFAGYRRGRAKPRLLPFSPGINVGLGEESYHLPAKSGTPVPECNWFSKKEITRTMSFSGETWKAEDLIFRVLSFFGSVPDPITAKPAELKKAVRPAILVELTFDNSKAAEPLIGFFGMQGIHRPLSDSTNRTLAGFASGTQWGYAAFSGKDGEESMDWSVLNTGLESSPPLRKLASEGLIRWQVAPGEKKSVIVALGAFRDGIITSGFRAHAYYTVHFKDLEEVLASALEDAKESIKKAEKLDEILENAKISNERKFLIAHAAHSYNASSELLVTESGDPLFIVNEGEYRMMNTLDLTVDQAFWELKWSPWTVKNELDFFLSRSSYNDTYGIAFCHDQGVADCFTPAGTSVYELPKLTGCFSYMSFEETLNWILTACLYAESTNDAEWINSKTKTFRDCLLSIIARDKNGDGILDVDSDRCSGGAEITTYDSLDISLGQARNNLYLGVKTWAAYVCLEALFINLGGTFITDAERAKNGAERAAKTICSRMIREENYIPAVFEADNTSKIIPAVEGLIYPLFCGAPEAVKENGPYADLIKILKTHLITVLEPGVCLDKVSGGWKLSSTSNNTWLSKIFINQYVAENILGLAGDKTRRDAVHVSWQQNGSADWAATDQVTSDYGKDLGSRLYPRLVSSVLWLEGLGKKS